VTRARLDLAFFAVIAIMAAHESEHVGQIIQKNGLENSCPKDCRGVLGFLFDVEWVHALYNHSLLLFLIGLYAGYRLWRKEWRGENRNAWLALTAAIFVVQGYHAIEHAVKIDQWLARGHKSPQPGILGQHFSLIELHFVINTIVFAGVAIGYFGLGFHKRLRAAWIAPVAIAVPLVLAVPVAWGTRTPTTVLEAGTYQGPLVIDSRRKVVGRPGTIVRGGIRITADGVQLRNVTVIGGEHGIEIRGAKNVILRNVTVRGATLDGIFARRSSVNVDGCTVETSRPMGQGIDISFGMGVGPSVVQNCRVVGGLEGIATHFTHVDVRDNHISGTSLRGIAMTEMSMGHVDDNQVFDALGVGIFCGDYSDCSISGNLVSGTRHDYASQVRTRAGYAIQAHYGASAKVADNRLVGNAQEFGAFINAEIRHD
jgi:hypothetical protein